VSSDKKILESHFDPVFSIAPVAFGVIGILLAMWMYKKESNKPHQVSLSLGALYKAASKKFYIDEIYLFITQKIIFNLIGRPAAWIDRNIVDGLMNGIANTTATISGLIKGLQSGKVQSYAIYFFGGIVALAIVFLYLWK
jgi:NADH-quinone oxidoreductase subunit L